MKKLFLLSLVMVFTLALTAQDKTKTVKMNVNETFVADVTTAADSLADATQDTVDYIYYLNKEYPVQYYIYCDVDSIHGTPVVAFTLSGRVFDSEAWSTITTVNYTGSADTTFTFSSVGSQVFTASLSGTGTSRMSAAQTLIFDTTKTFPNGSYVFGRDSAFALRQAAGTIVDTLANAETLTGTLTCNTIASYYRQFRVRAITTTGHALFSNLTVKIWRREF